MLEYSIVISAYNEAKNITASLTQITSFMRTFAKEFEIVIVDDGSEDDTANLVESYAKENPEVKLLRNKHKGKGPGIYAGIMAAEGKFIYMADADLSTPISEIKRLANWIIEHEFDIVIASREGLGAKRIKEPLYRHLMGRVFNFFVRVIALPGIQDSQCGFKLFKKEAAKEIFEKLSIYGKDAPEISEAYLGAFDVEVLYIAKKLGYKIKTVPVEWTYMPTERLNPIKDSILMLRDVIKVRLNDRKGVYL
ncbi:dolichyl-phosphate beta-glucosyltransferase [Patescibacteria group bacterium]